VVPMPSQVSDDGMMGTDGCAVGCSLVVDGSPVRVGSSSEMGESSGSAAVGNSSGVAGSTLMSGSVGMDSDGSSHHQVGVSVNSLGADSVMVGAEVAFVIDASVVGALSHPSNGGCDSSSGAVPSRVPDSELVVGPVLVVVSVAESGGGDPVVADGSHSGVEGRSHPSPGPDVVSDGLGVSSDLVAVGAGPSEEETMRGSSSVLGVEVVVGLNEPSSDECEVLADVSHAGSLGLLEVAPAAEEGGVGESGAVVSSASSRALGLSADESRSVAAAHVVPSATAAPVHEGTVFVAPVVGLSSVPVSVGDSVAISVDPVPLSLSVVESDPVVASGVFLGESLLSRVVDGSDAHASSLAEVLSRAEVDSAGREVPFLGASVGVMASHGGGGDGS